MKERLRWLVYILWMKDERLPNIVLFGQLPRAKWKAGCLCLGWKDIIKKYLKEIGTSWEGVKRGSLNGLGWRRSMCSCVGLRQVGAVVNCSTNEVLNRVLKPILALTFALL